MERRKHNNVGACSTLVTLVDSIRAEEDDKVPIKMKKFVTKCPKILFIEPFYGGSHKQLIDLLLNNTSHTFISCTAKKWPWRARCSGLICSQLIPELTTEEILFCSSVLNLPELLGLRPDLNRLKKIVYFHENQFIFPIRQIKGRDIQFAYNQITTCLAADQVIFNSNFNKDSFLGNLKKIIKMLPDYRPKNLLDKISPKCMVLYFPVSFPELPSEKQLDENELHIVWPHRWEFDKDPELFLETLMELKKDKYSFKVHILGENFEDVSATFGIAKEILKANILTFGFVQSKKEYYDILNSSHVAISTAIHEFFGVSMMESYYCGCFPLVPNDLVYPEIYPKECLYKDPADLLKKLRKYCKNPKDAIKARSKLKIDVQQYSGDTLLPEYLKLLHLN